MFIDCELLGGGPGVAQLGASWVITHAGSAHQSRTKAPERLLWWSPFAFRRYAWLSMTRLTGSEFQERSEDQLQLTHGLNTCQPVSGHQPSL